MPYLSTGLVGCLVGSGISRDAYKLVRTPQVIKKNKIKSETLDIDNDNNNKLKKISEQQV